MTLEKKCIICGKSSSLIAEALSLCPDCIRLRHNKAEPVIEMAHRRSRMGFGLPEKPPGNKDGVQCNICINQCRIGEGEKGFCGLRDNRNGRLHHLAGTPERGLVSWYYDPLPTNCVADWVCPGGSSSGYPRYSFSRGPEHGYENLAVFYEACSFNCLFCQNWHFRASKPGGVTKSARELAAAVTKTTSCICYFGGDPTPQLDHALAASRLALENAKGRILRICWETNGSMNGSLLEKMARLSMESGGCIKFDLKAFDSNLHRALTNSSNKQTLDNFKQLAEISRQRADPPFLIASTLLVPGYVDPREVSRIATFIASLDRTIPYTLLAFHPHFYMNDLPRTSRTHAEESVKAAREAGLERVKVGNLHLLSEDY